MASLFTLPKQQAFNSSGDPIAAARLFFYETGTTNPKNTYSDLDLNAPHANPVIADAYGVFAPVWLDTEAGNYRVKLTDTNLVEQWTVDDIGSPALTSAMISDTLDSLKRTAAEIAVGVTPTNSGYYPGDLRRYGWATGASPAANAIALQAAVDQAANGGVSLRFPAGTYSCNRVTCTDLSNIGFVGDNTVINLAGSHVENADPNSSRWALFTMSGVCSNLIFTGIRFVGDGGTVNQHRVFGYNSGTPPTLSNISFWDCRFEGCMVVAILPGVQGATFLGCKVKDSAGEASGQGLGFVTELSGATRAANVRIIGCEFDNTTRHGVYINHCDGVTLQSLLFRNHRSTLFTATATSTGRYACVISRSTGISGGQLVFRNCRDAALGIDQDSTHTIADVEIDGVVLYQTRGLSLGIGRTVNSGDAKNIRVSNVVLTTDVNWADPDISITDPNNVTLDGLVIDAERAYAASHIVIRVTEYLASYVKNFKISGVRGVISGAGSNYLVEISAGLAASSGGLIELLDNQLIGATRLYLYGTTGACTNANIRSDWDFEPDITASGTPSIAGYNRFNVLLAAPGNITGFANGYDGKAIELFFANANATLTSAMFLAGAVNFVGSSSDYLRLKYRLASTNWFELGRSVN